MRPTKVKRLAKVLGNLGFRLERIHGSHLIFKHNDGRITVVPRQSFSRRHRAAALASVAGLVFLLVLMVAVGTYIFLSVGPHAPSCDTQLSTQIGASASHLCLRPLNITLSSSNSSEFYVPVLVMKPGTTGTIDILYHISARTSGSPAKANLTSADAPLVLSASANVNRSRVGFSDGMPIFQNSAWVIYRYTVNSSADSIGYYAILPPFYYGMYPALAIGADPNNLNMSALSMWGFTGIIVSGEFIVPSEIVGTGGLEIVNASIPGVPDCPNPACAVISHSGS